MTTTNPIPTAPEFTEEEINTLISDNEFDRPLPEIIFEIPIKINHTNGGGWDEVYSITPNRDEIDEYLAGREFNEGDYFYEIHTDHQEVTYGITNPEEISNRCHNDYVYGFKY